MLTFDQSVDDLKQELRVKRWDQVIDGERKPSALQMQVLDRNMYHNLALIGICGVLYYWFS